MFSLILGILAIPFGWAAAGGVCTANRSSASAWCNHYTYTCTSTAWGPSKTSTTTVTVTTVGSSTITTTSCGISPLTTVTSVAGATTKAKRSAPSKPNCLAQYNSGPEISSACKNGGWPVHETTWWWHHTGPAKTVTKTKTVTGTVVVESPIVNFLLMAFGSGTSADGQYASVDSGHPNFNKSEEHDPTSFTLSGTSLIEQSGGYHTTADEIAMQGAGDTAVEFFSDPSDDNVLECTPESVNGDCTLACTVAGNSVDYLCAGGDGEAAWYIGTAVESGCTSFTPSVVPVSAVVPYTQSMLARAVATPAA